MNHEEKILMHADCIVSTYNAMVEDPDLYLDDIKRIEYAIKILKELRSYMTIHKEQLAGKPITVEKFCIKKNLFITKAQAAKLGSMAKSICDRQEFKTSKTYSVKNGKKDSVIMYPVTVFPEYILLQAAKEFGLLPTRYKAA